MFLDIFISLQLLGIVVSAISGVMVASERHLDLFGALVLGCVTAVGGGIIRDILLGITPPQMFRDPTFVLLALGVSMATVLVLYYHKVKYLSNCRAGNRDINPEEASDKAAAGIDHLCEAAAAAEPDCLPKGDLNETAAAAEPDCLSKGDQNETAAAAEPDCPSKGDLNETAAAAEPDCLQNNGLNETAAATEPDRSEGDDPVPDPPEPELPPVYDFILNSVDSFGLAVFAISGVQTVFNCGYEHSFFLSMFIGLVTAVGGGVLRDILAGKTPVILRKRIYALAALAGCFLYYICFNLAGMGVITASIISIAFMVILRHLSYMFEWNMPSL